VPFAVEVHTGGIGAQVAAARAVGIAVGHHMEAAELAELAGMRIGRIGQHVERAFHPPFRHRFAGMLARDQPDLLLAFAEREAIDRLSIEARPQHAVGDAFAHARFGDEIVVPFHRIGAK